MSLEKNNQYLLEKKRKEMDFLHHFHLLGYDLLDLSLLEEFEWDRLSEDDLKMMKSRHTWQTGHSLLSLRSDWTDAIVRYRKKYKLKTDKIAYSGPVFPMDKEKMQFGMEIFTEDIGKQIDTMKELIQYIKENMALSLNVAVISHYSLLKKLLSENERQEPEIMRYLDERNLDGLTERLGDSHPVVRLMSQPVPEQLDYAKAHYPDLRKPVEEIKRWQDQLQKNSIPVVYCDLFSIPPQSYYKGIFLQFYTDHAVEPVVTGGQYSSPTRAFGMAINLSSLSLMKNIERGKFL
ncbi:ATP phosphoribosyltransferase regulatory subunit HisZ [Alkalibacterium subtropicum]|uniref:ATP phosphoribosyltransferase regulatory subunit HisZ n=1 Tax=Alkalibacterium subtropicum TaxID=753702 RepID=A0A1I1HD49_9LACT|nr:ATP phosphoribosyltransferase regulatory subunit [Alkalibacterium subtropicum]SFC21726.1 ATP phosphoribosyltransferase regulatory subunit HisZ [Alkalibacterium subtropicum]